MTTEELNKMTDGEKRVRIAELCGAKWYLFASGYTWLSLTDLSYSEQWTAALKPADSSRIVMGNTIPDYLNDLNAMHKAEMSLGDGDYHAFTLQLADMSHRIHGSETVSLHSRYRVAFSGTARQRAEAFLLTLG